MSRVLIGRILLVLSVMIAGWVEGAPAVDGATVSPIEVSVSRLVQSMSVPERVGQLFMAGGGSTTNRPTTLDVIRRYHVGSVILNGRSDLGVTGTRSVTDELQAETSDVHLFVAVDQEGGQVQRLHGPGFSEIPSAVEQGKLAPDTLRSRAAVWGRQLSDAGVNLDLAPVLDVVPAGTESQNPPIGWYDRQYGSTPDAVAASGTAFAGGMRQGHVTAVGKHFPGLGRVTANTDTTPHVTETVTTRHDAFTRPFAAAIGAGAPMIMMSSVYYEKIDALRPAAFSHLIVTGMLRGDLGFQGVVISDSIGAMAFQDYPVARRAVRFIAAGGDLVLAGDPNLIPSMHDAVVARVAASARFAAKVDAAVRRVLLAKVQRGLVPSIPRSGRIVGRVRGLTASGNELVARGWAFDADTATSIKVVVRVDGQRIGVLTANRYRKRVGERWPAWGPNHGFSGRFPLAAGPHRACVRARNVGAGKNRRLACADVTGGP